MNRTRTKTNRLRAYRIQKRFTLQDIADLTGFSVALLSRAERGERSLSPDAKVTLARCLNVRVAELFDPDEPDAAREEPEVTEAVR